MLHSNLNKWKDNPNAPLIRDAPSNGYFSKQYPPLFPSRDHNVNESISDYFTRIPERHIFCNLILSLDYSRFKHASILSLANMIAWINSCSILINGGDLMLRTAPPSQEALDELIYVLEHDISGIQNVKIFTQQGLIFCR